MCRNSIACARARLRCISTNVYCRENFKGRICRGRFIPTNQARCSCQ